MRTSIGAAVRRARRRRGRTQAAVAAHVGIHRVHLAQIESGAERPSLALLEKLAKALNADEWLFIEAYRRLREATLHRSLGGDIRRTTVRILRRADTVTKRLRVKRVLARLEHRLREEARRGDR